MKVIVIGLDGGCWTLINKWIDNCELPNLQKVKEEGCWAHLQSCLPPVTSPNWKCYSTGKNPGKLGIFWWEIVDFKNGNITIPRSYSFDGMEIWDYLTVTGKRAGIVNMPTNYPPKEVNGFIISGGPDASEHGFCYPTDLEKELTNRYDYRVTPKYIDFVAKGDDEALEEVFHLIDLRFKVGKELFVKYELDFLHVTVFLINALQHYFGDDEIVLKGWKIIDRNIGDYLQTFDDCNFIFMSDHGTNNIKCKFNINIWLQNEGYLKINKNSLKRLLFKLGINKDNIVRLLAKMRLKNFFKKVLSEETSNLLPTSDGSIMLAGKQNVIDWQNSKAYALGQGPIYINPGLSAEEREKIGAEIQNKLSALECQIGGLNIAQNVYHGEEIYSGKYLENAPDLIIDQNDGIHISNSIGFKPVFEEPLKWKGENARYGMFGAYGPDIKPGYVDGEVSIVDLAPTILHIMGEAINRDMDGRVLKEIFRDDSALFKNSVRFKSIDSSDRNQLQKDQEDEEQIKERLKSLGYLG